MTQSAHKRRYRHFAWALVLLAGACSRSGFSPIGDVDGSPHYQDAGDSDGSTIGDSGGDDSPSPQCDPACNPGVTCIAGSFCADDPMTLAAGGEVICALARGRPVCWGRNLWGNMGTGRVSAGSSTPTPVAGIGGSGVLTNVLQLVGGRGEHFCAVLTDATAVCWGANDYGQLGDGTRLQRAAPVIVLNQAGTGPLTDVTAVAGGLRHGCAVTQAGHVYCWGRNEYGQLGDGTSGDSLLPVQVVGVGGTGVLGNMVDVGAGTRHSCALSDNNGVYCWGRNLAAELGDGSRTSSKSPRSVLAPGLGVLDDAVELDVGSLQSCARRLGGTVACWGWNNFGVRGNGSNDAASRPTDVVGVGSVGLLSKVVQLSAGALSTCAVLASKEVVCWGANGSGGLGDGSAQESHVPVYVVDESGAGRLAGVTEVVASRDLFQLACARTSTRIWCWGSNAFGTLGDGAPLVAPLPQPVPGIAQATEVSAGNLHACARLSTGGAACWGDGSFTQLGNQSRRGSSAPVSVQGAGGIAPLSGVVEISLGFVETCVRQDDERAMCWGANFRGRLGTGRRSDTTGAVETIFPDPEWVVDTDSSAGGADNLPLEGVLQVSSAANGNHRCAVRRVAADTGVVCWGDASGLGTDIGSKYTSVPVEVEAVGGGGALRGVVQVATGAEFGCARLNDGAVVCWGDNDEGQLGNGSTSASVFPVVVSGLDGTGGTASALDLALGAEHCCVVVQDQTVRCWGGNDDGQLGVGTQVGHSVPTTVPNLTKVVAVDVNRRHSCALLSDGTMQCWGGNYMGQLGDGTTDSRSTPAPVTNASGSGPLTGVSQMSTGRFVTCALLEDTTVSCWGLRSGIGDTVHTVDSPQPQAVTALP